MSVLITTIIFTSLVIGFLFASIELVNRSYKVLVVLDEDTIDENSRESDQQSTISNLKIDVETLKQYIEQDKKLKTTIKDESNEKEKTNDFAGV